MPHKNTKIVCTLGPASSDPKTLEKMIRAGMNVARLNFSHGTYSEFAKMIKTIRALSKKLNTPIAILQDLQGPKIRIGEVPKEGIAIKKGEVIILSTADKTYKKVHGISLFPVQFKHLHKDVGPKDTILIDDGLMELTVKKVSRRAIYCEAATDGTIKSHKGINVPTASLSADPLTEGSQRSRIRYQARRRLRSSSHLCDKPRYHQAQKSSHQKMRRESHGKIGGMRQSESQKIVEASDDYGRPWRSRD